MAIEQENRTAPAPTAPSGSDGRQVARPEPEVIPPSLEPVFRNAGVNPEDPSVKLAVELSLMMYRGPLPPPQILAEFEKVQPGLVSKMIGWTEEQGAHRKALENQKTTGDETRKNRGQWIAAGIAFFGLSLATIQGIWGNSYVASIIAIVSIGGPLAALLLAIGMGYTPKKPELPKPQKETTPPIKPGGDPPSQTPEAAKPSA
jgi:uncharacterized membrane protein